MKWFKWVRNLRQQPFPADVIQRVAERSKSDVWNAVAASVSEMSTAESRGYVRVRAVEVVEFETRIATASLCLSDELQRGVCLAARDIVVDLTMAEIRRRKRRDPRRAERQAA